MYSARAWWALPPLVLGCVGDQWSLRAPGTDAQAPPGDAARDVVDAAPIDAATVDAATVDAATVDATSARALVATQPPSATLLSTTRPRLFWRNPDGGQITLRICRSRACPPGDVVFEERGFFARTPPLESWRAATDFAPGRYWWTLRSDTATTLPRWFEVPTGPPRGGTISAGGRLLPDLDGDGRTEIVAGAPISDGAGTSGAFVVVDPRTSERRVTSAPAGASRRFAEDVMLAGDTDGDGRQEVLVIDPPSRAYVFYADGQGRYDRYVTLTPDDPADLFAVAAAGVGDVDSDGYADVAVSSFVSTFPRIRIHHGGPSGTPTRPTATLLGGYRRLDATMSLTALGDRNGDGFGDLAAGLPASLIPGAMLMGRGVAFVLSGDAMRFQGLDAAPPGYSGFSSLGRRLFASGDVDNDGILDAVVAGTTPVALVLRGPIGERFGAWSSGRSAELRCAPADAPTLSLAPVGDINADGFDDVVRAVPGRCGAVDFGVTSPVGSSLNPPTTPPPPDWALLQGSVLQRDGEMAFGAAVAGPGDVNGDGIPDVVISSPRSTGPGRIYVYFGRRGGAPNDVPDLTLEDSTPGFGRSLAR